MGFSERRPNFLHRDAFDVLDDDENEDDVPAPVESESLDAAISIDGNIRRVCCWQGDSGDDRETRIARHVTRVEAYQTYLSQDEAMVNRRLVRMGFPVKMESVEDRHAREERNRQSRIRRREQQMLLEGVKLGLRIAATRVEDYWTPIEVATSRSIPHAKLMDEMGPLIAGDLRDLARAPRRTMDNMPARESPPSEKAKAARRKEPW